MKLVDEVSKEKLRGGFYTPEPIAKFILQWTTRGLDKPDILEPSCGDGVFLRQVRNLGVDYNTLTGLEIVEEEAKKAQTIQMPRSNILNEDFLEYCESSHQEFDVVVGNPPYIRYQYLTDDQHEKAKKIFHMSNIRYSRLSNAWIAFVIGGSLLLRKHGRIGFVLPAELLQTSNTKALREFLVEYFAKIEIITFRELVFSGIEQEVIIFLAERNSGGRLRINHKEVRDISELASLDMSELESKQKEVKNPESNKWTYFFLAQEEIDLLEELRERPPFESIRNYASVQVGITTGYNQFFTVPYSTVKKYELDSYAKPMVGRSIHVPSLRFTKEDWLKNVRNRKRAYFLIFSKKDALSKRALQYIEQGEKAGIHKGYKCSIREEWQIVPSVWISDALFVRRNNIYPKLILNEAEAYTTDTMHRVKTRSGVDRNAFVASYYNSISLAFAEICGRSHGGGALELMPNEAEDILIPYHERNAALAEDIDKMLRDEMSIDDIIRVTDGILLHDRFSFPESKIQIANRMWKKLRTRRLSRSKSV